MTPQEHYQDAIKKGHLLPDAAQVQVVNQLQRLYMALRSPAKSTSLWLPRLTKRNSTPVQGIYLWGGTGRGKTCLMDAFYACLEFPEKHRVHFHRFMRDIHHRLQAHAYDKDPIKLICRELSTQIRLLCLDEFHVSDITDAMIMARLLEGLFENGITLVATSNIAIKDLYPNGLQRERFMPAIHLLQQHTDEISVNGEADYRSRMLQANRCYQVVAPEHYQTILTPMFNELATVPPKHGREIEINGHLIHYYAWANDLIWFDFLDLCNTPRATSDYMDIAKQCHTVFISGVPRMGEGQNDMARRFIHLIDTFYDNHTCLIVSAETEPAELYHGINLKFEFDRTISRLTEMNSQGYIRSM